MHINEIVEKYVATRDKKKALQESHKLELAPYNEILDGLEAVMLRYMQEQNINSIATNGGTAYQSARTSFTVEDPVLFREWVAQQGDLTFFESRASKAAVEAYLEATGAIPDGLKYTADVTVNFRRS
jgi:hypothetical protein